MEWTNTKIALIVLGIIAVALILTDNTTPYLETVLTLIGLGAGWEIRGRYVQA